MYMKTVIFCCNDLSDNMEPAARSGMTPLTTVLDKPVLSHILENLKNHGFSEATLVLPNKSGAYLKYAESERLPLSLKFFCGEGMTDVGAVRRLWEGGDVLCIDGAYLNFFDASGLVKYHEAKNSDLTLAVKEVAKPWEFSAVSVGEGDKLLKFSEFPSAETCSTNFAYSGVYIVSEKLVAKLPPDTTETLPQLAKKACEKGGKALVYNEKGWFHRFSKPSDVLSCNLSMLSGESGRDMSFMESSSGCFRLTKQPFRGVSVIPPVFIGKNVTVGFGTVLDSGTVLCDNVTVGRGCHIKGSALMENVRVGDGVKAEGALICRDAQLMKGVECEKMTIIGAGSAVGENTVLKSGTRVWDGKEIRGGQQLSGDVKERSGEILFDDDGAITDYSGFVTPSVAAEIGMAAGSALEKGAAVVIGASTTSKAALALENAVASGLSSAGAEVWRFGETTFGQSCFAMNTTGAKLGIFINAEFSTALKFFDKGGLKLPVRLERKIENALNHKRFRNVGNESFGDVTDGKALGELYAKALSDMLEPKLSGVNVSVRTTEKSLAKLADRLFYPRNDLSGETVTFHVNQEQGTLSAYTEKTGYVFWEKLVLIACEQNFALDLPAALPFTFPDAADRLALKMDGVVMRYRHSAEDDTDSEARKAASAFENLFVKDPLLLAVRVADRMSREKKSLKALAAAVPDFYSAQRFVAAKASGTEVLHALSAEDKGEGVVSGKENARAVVRPLRNGGIMIFANAYKAETASSLCDDIEKKIRALSSQSEL